jgi:hypothetical protein
MNASSKIVLFIVLLTLFFACKKSESFSEIPYLEFTKYELKDSVIDALGNSSDLYKFYLYFTDGNGDIGLSKNDTIHPYEFNLFVNYFEMHQDSLILIDLTSPYHIRIPNLTPTGQNKSLKGDIVWDVVFFPQDTINRKSDTIKFEFQLFDRALNKSEWVSSPLIIFN